ncbi:MAG: sortase [bacterium]
MVAKGQDIQYDIHMLKEPTIHQIEQLLKSFRLQGGSDAEINAIAQDIVRDFRPETITPIEKVFTKEQHPSIKKITRFKKSKKKPIRHTINNIWHHWYVKYPVILVSTFMIIFIITNLPLYFAKTQHLSYRKEPTQAPVTKKSVVAKSAPLEPGETIPSTPTLVVPKINVTAPIVFINSADEAQIQTGLQSGVVHYFQTAEPGKVGNSFITGHSSNYWWDKGSYNYVFANLDKLEIGDQAKIFYQGNKYLYQVASKKIVEATEMSVLNQTIKPTLTLMTCTPPGTSWKRLIVSFDQISPEYISEPIKITPSSAPTKSPTTTTTTLPKSDSNTFIDFIGKLLGI